MSWTSSLCTRVHTVVLLEHAYFHLNASRSASIRQPVFRPIHRGAPNAHGWQSYPDRSKRHCACALPSLTAAGYVVYMAKRQATYSTGNLCPCFLSLPGLAHYMMTDHCLSSRLRKQQYVSHWKHCNGWILVEPNLKGYGLQHVDCTIKQRHNLCVTIVLQY